MGIDLPIHPEAGPLGMGIDLPIHPEFTQKPDVAHHR